MMSIAGRGRMSGVPENVFIEDQGSVIGALENHTIPLLTDSLAVYNLLGALDPDITTAEITPLLDAASNEAEQNLESIDNALAA